MLLEPRCKEESHSIALKPFGCYTRDMYLIAGESGSSCSYGQVGKQD